MREINQEVYKDKLWQWQEGEYTVTRTSQWSGPGCHQGCGVLFYTKDGKVEKIEGDPNCPVNNGRLCMRCLDMLEAIYHEDRLTYPMKRAGERGENKWERISWDEALDIIDEQAKRIMGEYGGKAIAAFQGTGRNATWPVSSLGNLAFDTPNTGQGTLSGDCCYGPRLMAMNVVMGTAWIADMGQALEARFDDPRYRIPEYVLIWGCNPLVSNSDGFYGHWIIDVMKRGSKLIVVDPRITWIAAKAELVLRLRPGTDGAVALGIVSQMIENKWYDEEFTDEWVYGLEGLREAAAEYTPERVEEISCVPAWKIVKAAEILGHAKPLAVQWGLPLDQQTHGVSASHAIQAIIALTGNVDIPGSNIFFVDGFIQNDIRMSLLERMDPESQKAKLGCDGEYPLRSMGYAPFAMPEKVLQAIEEGDPYPIKMVWIQSSNPLSNCAADSKRWLKALNSLDFVVVADLYMTPTAVACADLVLPVAMSPERDSMRAWWTPFRAITKVVEPLGEAKCDETIMLEVGRKVAPEKFPWANTEEMRAAFMENLSSVDYEGSFEDLKHDVWYYFPFEYEKYKTGKLRSDGKPGFNTPTGKIELMSTIFQAVGLDAAPYYKEPNESPVSTPELAEKYPFVLTTGQRSYEFFHSEHRNLPTMREYHPWPLCEMNPEDAASLGLEEGDWVYLENETGKIKQKLHIHPGMLKGVVNAEHGWWFPEREAAAPSFFGTFDSQAGCLLRMGDVGPTGWGSSYKCRLCNVSKVED